MRWSISFLQLPWTSTFLFPGPLRSVRRLAWAPFYATAAPIRFDPFSTGLIEVIRSIGSGDVILRTSVAELPSTARPTCTVTNARLVPMTRSIEPIRLRTTANGKLGGRGVSGVNDRRSIDHRRSRLSLTISWVYSRSEAAVSLCPVAIDAAPGHFSIAGCFRAKCRAAALPRCRACCGALTRPQTCPRERTDAKW